MNTSVRSIETWRCILLVVLTIILLFYVSTWEMTVVALVSITIFVDVLFLSYWSIRKIDYIQRRFIYIRSELNDTYMAMHRTLKERLPNSISGEDYHQLRGVFGIALLIFLLYLVFSIIPRLLFQLLWGVTCMIWYFIHWTASMIFMNTKDDHRHQQGTPLLAIGVYVFVLYGTLGVICYSLSFFKQMSF